MGGISLSVLVTSGVALLIWLLGVSFAAGVAIQKSRETKEDLDEHVRSMARVLTDIASIKADVRWLVKAMNGERDGNA
jgi:hypothetical protein